MSYLAERLKKEIREKGIKQIDVCRALGLSPSRLSNYLSGAREPDFELICKLAKYLEKPVSYFSEYLNDLEVRTYLCEREKVFTILRLMTKNIKGGKKAIIDDQINLLEKHLNVDLVCLASSTEDLSDLPESCSKSILENATTSIFLKFKREDEGVEGKKNSQNNINNEIM